jgi:hypothetical protein
MRVHLRLCVLCRRYQHQTYLIARVARKPADRGPDKAPRRVQKCPARTDSPPNFRIECVGR